MCHGGCIVRGQQVYALGGRGRLLAARFEGPRHVAGAPDQLAGAGYYGQDAVRLFVGAKVLLAGILASATYAFMAFSRRCAR